jgi:hypothetical protein
MRAARASVIAAPAAAAGRDPYMESALRGEGAMVRGLAAAIFALVMLALPAAADPRPVVVELFTSQGCSSCPPADALLGELVRRADVVALGFHISYWDRLGWKDPLSSQGSTERQKTYARRFHTPVYTPQLVVDGTSEMVGSDRDAVLGALRAARPEAIAPVAFAADRRSVAIDAGEGGGEVLLVRFIQRQTTDVAAGENAGRTLRDANGVKSSERIGTWDGARREFQIEPPAAGEGLAVIVQAPDGKMLGAAMALGPG